MTKSGLEMGMIGSEIPAHRQHICTKRKKTGTGARVKQSTETRIPQKQGVRSCPDHCEHHFLNPDYVTLRCPLSFRMCCPLLCIPSESPACLRRPSKVCSSPTNRSPSDDIPSYPLQHESPPSVHPVGSFQRCCPSALKSGSMESCCQRSSIHRE